MNKRQKNIIMISAFLIIAAFIIWMLFGGEIFTKTQVLVDAQTDLEKELGITHQTWEDKFILGLDYTLAFSGLIVLAGGIATFLTRTKKNK